MNRPPLEPPVTISSPEPAAPQELLENALAP
jgi:hypothetical protein